MSLDKRVGAETVRRKIQHAVSSRTATLNPDPPCRKGSSAPCGPVNCTFPPQMRESGRPLIRCERLHATFLPLRRKSVRSCSPIGGFRLNLISNPADRSAHRIGRFA
jgi:hypothetical protein